MNNSPISSSSRIQELDVFRGFAILGIFMVNILVMNVSFAYRYEWEAEHTSILQRASFFILETFFYSKFYVIFSLLFGIGVAMQMQSFLNKGTFSYSFFLRRFSSLFLFGMAHILFLWSGDILHLYGLLGMLLLLFFGLKPKPLLWASILVFSFPLYPTLFNHLMEWVGLDFEAPLSALSRESILQLKHQGSYMDGIKLRLKEYGFAMGLIYSGIAPISLAMMLLGGFIVKSGIINILYSFAFRIAKPLIACFFILMAYRFFVMYYLLPNVEIEHGSALSIFLMTIYQLSDIATSMIFLWAITILWNKGSIKFILKSLQFVGRMALSNYIFQSVAGYFIMRTLNGYEFFTPFECILLVLSIYIVQIGLSKAWLSRFKFGPLEWLWRCISYWKLLPIK